MGKLWYGGNIYTLRSEHEQVEALYTEDKYIVGMGNKTDLENVFKESISETIDLEGKTLLPGFVDSHMHLIGLGETLIRLDLSSYSSKESVLKAVKEHAKKVEKGEWIIGEGWNENLWENPEPLTMKELDDAISGHPILLKRICRHASVANSMAFELANISEDTVCPQGGVIEKDKTGKLTGLLKDQAQELLVSILPEVSGHYLERAMRAAIDHLHKLGVTGVHTEDLNYYGSYQKTLKTFKRVVGAEKNRFRTHLLVHHGVIEESIEEGNHFLSGDEWIEFGAMKIFSDGALGGRTALLSKPYFDDPTTSGVAIFSQRELNELVKKARRYNLPVAIHAIGDLAFEYALNAIEKHPLKGRGRDRLIHAQILREDLIKRAVKLPLILDIQPQFLASDFPWVMERIGPDNMEYCYAWKTLLDAGIPCAGGSDAPIESGNPLNGIYAAVTRTSRVGSETVYYPNEKLTVYEAVSLFTKGSAYAACHEKERGILQTDYLADFTVLEENIFKVNAERIPDIKTAMTVVGGDIVFKVQNERK